MSQTEANNILALFQYPSVTVVDTDNKQIYCDIDCILFERSQYEINHDTYNYTILARSVHSNTSEGISAFGGNSDIYFTINIGKEPNVDDPKIYKKFRTALENKLNDQGITLTRGFKAVRVMERFTLPQVEFNTNVGKQLIDLKCVIEKRFMSKSDITLFERLFLGKKLYLYSVDIIPTPPIKEIRRGDDDATYGFGASLKPNLYSNEVDFSHDAAVEAVMNRVKDFDVDVIKSRQLARKNKKKSWKSRMLFKKHFKSSRLSCFTLIYPFFDDHASGWTDIASLTFHSDNEEGYGIGVALFGVHLRFFSEGLTKKIKKQFITHRPDTRGLDYKAWSPIIKQWEKDYKFEHFLDSDWDCKIGISRARGLFWTRSFDQGTSSKWGWRFNPLRNKFWNLI